MTFLETFHRDIFYSANTFFDINKREPLSIKEEIKINMTSSVRIIGICIETRPDAINDEWIRFFIHCDFNDWNLQPRWITPIWN